MTKREIKEFAKERGFEASYSGSEKKHYFKKVLPMNIHHVINSK